MAQTQDMVEALKHELRRSGVTYAAVATELKLSESSVKRMFANYHFTLARLQSVCDMVNLELSDLATIADQERRNIEQLDEAQEQELVGNEKLLLVAFLLLNHWDVERITHTYDIAPLEAVRLLARLDRMKIIDLLPGNRVRVRLSRRFAWRHNGPIQRFFESQVQSEFFKSRFDGPGELRLVLNAMLSDQSIGSMHQRMQRLATEFEHCVIEESRSPSQERSGTTLVMAIRPWALGMFESYRRP